MNDVGAQRLGIHFAKRLCAGSFDLVWRSFQASPEHIVFAACVNTDHSPHSMIVRHDHTHPRGIARAAHDSRCGMCPSGL